MGGGAAAERGEEGLGLGVGVGEEEGEGPGRLVEWGQVGSRTVLAGHLPDHLPGLHPDTQQLLHAWGAMSRPL